MGLFKSIKQGIESSLSGPDPEQTEAALASLTPEQRAAYDAQMAKVAEAQAESQASFEEARAIGDQARVLDGPAGDYVHGPKPDDGMSPDAIARQMQAGGSGSVLKQAFKQSFSQFGDVVKDTMASGKVDEITDPALRAQVQADQLAARTAARQPYFGPSAPQVAISRIATRGKSQMEELVAHLQRTGLSAHPERVFGVYRVPDRISQALTVHSEKGRVVEWDIVHLVGAESGADSTEVVDAWFPAPAQWVARRIGEPSVLDEDLAAAYCVQAGIGPEQCLGIARHGNFIHRTWDRSEDLDPIVPQIVGVHVLHPAGLGAGVVEAMAAAAPLPLGPDALTGVHTEVLNAVAIRQAVHQRNQDPVPVPSPFPYLPGTPQELLVMYLQVVGIAPSDCYGAQVTRNHPEELSGRLGPAGSTNTGPKQPCADGKDRMRLHGAHYVVITYRDTPAYVEGRTRWAAYQEQVLQAHLERGTGARELVTSDSSADGLSNPLLRAAGHLADKIDDIEQALDGRRPNPYRYCWPPVD